MSNGMEFEYDRMYAVAIHSYRGSGGGGHLTRGAGIPKDELSNRVLSSTEKDLRYHIKNWIVEKKTIHPEIISTWQILPEDWWEKGRLKDYALLFGTEAPQSMTQLKNLIHK
jgi:2',3'-cyclic-nucleotide 2'-phosphodiesterase / 3'-nucleotidase